MSSLVENQVNEEVNNNEVIDAEIDSLEEEFELSKKFGNDDFDNVIDDGLRWNDEYDWDEDEQDYGDDLYGEYDAYDNDKYYYDDDFEDFEDFEGYQDYDDDSYDEWLDYTDISDYGRSRDPRGRDPRARRSDSRLRDPRARYNHGDHSRNPRRRNSARSRDPMAHRKSASRNPRRRTSGRSRDPRAKNLKLQRNPRRRNNGRSRDPRAKNPRKVYRSRSYDDYDYDNDMYDDDDYYYYSDDFNYVDYDYDNGYDNEYYNDNYYYDNANDFDFSLGAVNEYDVSKNNVGSFIDNGECNDLTILSFVLSLILCIAIGYIVKLKWKDNICTKNNKGENSNIFCNAFKKIKYRIAGDEESPAQYSPLISDKI